MTTFSEATVRARAERSISRSVTAKVLLEAAAESFSETKTYDVFLSHARVDSEIVLGVKLLLEDRAKTVYVDWIDDPQLDRSNVNARTADLLRRRMRRCRSLMCVHTENSSASKWMPWELGYFDGYSGAVAIFPVTRVARSKFEGQEYLGLYPYVDEGSVGLYGSPPPIQIKRGIAEVRDFERWLKAPRDFMRAR